MTGAQEGNVFCDACINNQSWIYCIWRPRYHTGDCNDFDKLVLSPVVITESKYNTLEVEERLSTKNRHLTHRAMFTANLLCDATAALYQSMDSTKQRTSETSRVFPVSDEKCTQCLYGTFNMCHSTVSERGNLQCDHTGVIFPSQLINIRDNCWVISHLNDCYCSPTDC